MVGRFQRIRRFRFGRTHLDRDIRDEFQFHTLMTTDELIAQGMDPARAREEAERRFGNVERHRVECERLGRQRERAAARSDFVLGVGQDVWQALRGFRRSPGFTALAIGVLALAIGANAAVFALVDAALLRPLPYPSPDRLVVVDGNFTLMAMERIGCSAAELADYQTGANSLATVGGFRSAEVDLSGGGPAERVTAIEATANLFELLGVVPSIGRTFLASEDAPDRSAVAILSYGLWQRRYAADPRVLGQNLTVGGVNRTIVGVLAPRVDFPRPAFPFARSPDIWLPLAPDAEELSDRSRYSITAMARLRDGVTIDQARAELDQLARAFESTHPRSYRGPNGEDGGWRITATPLAEAAHGSLRPTLLVLLAAVWLVALIACADVASLLLSRGLARQREMAVRTALGASRWRLIRQLLVESLILSMLAGAAGCLLGRFGVDALILMQPGGLPRADEIALDGRILGFTVGLSIVTGLVFGLLPALKGSRPAVGASLNEVARGTVGPRGTRVGEALVSLEAAVSVVLLIGAGLLVRSFVQLQGVDPGFRTERLLLARVGLTESRYGQPSKRVAFYDEILRGTQALAGVQAAGVMSIPPLSGQRYDAPISVEGRPFDPTAAPAVAEYRVVSAGVLETLGLSLRQGRSLTEQDAAGAPAVAVVNEALVARVFNGDAVKAMAQRIKLGAPTSPRPWLTVVGVVSDLHQRGLDTEPLPEIYAPLSQDPVLDVTLLVRTTGDPRDITGSLRKVVSGIDPEQPVWDMRTMHSVVSDSLARRRFVTLILGLFAALAVVLAAGGNYAVISCRVAQRAQELGVRVALGASRGDLIRLVLRRAFALTALGLLVGVGVAAMLGPLLGSLLYGVSGNDWMTFTAAPLALAAVALVASLAPALRASHADPLMALRHE